MTETREDTQDDEPQGEEREELAQQGRIRQTEQEEEDDGPAAA
ncbi:MAG: hypothetical protein QOC77_1229 [Thermoleophilaceae bacterium]|jgi:hypothetical protein|nr:hypothetical protein [Thermoleophilaceae bacterium]MEA2471938.1 hypothetical protein [Thermoleophilaceae bacterium]